MFLYLYLTIERFLQIYALRHSSKTPNSWPQLPGILTQGHEDGPPERGQLLCHRDRTSRPSNPSLTGNAMLWGTPLGAHDHWRAPMSKITAVTKAPCWLWVNWLHSCQRGCTVVANYYASSWNDFLESGCKNIFSWQFWSLKRLIEKSICRKTGRE